MKKNQLITILLIIIFCCIFTDPANAWVKSITAKSKDLDAMCSPGEISIGIEDQENSDLAPPSTPTFNCYMKISTDTNDLLEEIVTDSYTKHCWNVILFPFEEPGPPILRTATLSWDFSDISGNIELREGYDSCESGSVIVDMKAETSVDIPGTLENGYIKKQTFLTIVYTNDSDPGENSQMETQTITLTPGWNVISVPLALDSYALDDVIGDQLPGNCSEILSNIVLYFDSTKQQYEKAWYCGDCGWGVYYDNHWLTSKFMHSDINLELGRGALFQNRTGSSQSFSITGQTLDEEITLNIETGWHLLSIPKNLPVNIGNLGLSATGSCSQNSADRILYWNQDGQNYTQLWFCDCNDSGWDAFNNRWLNIYFSESNHVLNPGEAILFKNDHSAFTWAINH